MKRLLLVGLLLLFSAQVSESQIYRLAEMNVRQISALDRNKTVILMPGGTMEQHGPYLPSFSDGYMNEWWAENLAKEIVRRPGWTVVMYPTIPIGDGGANEIGFKYVYPGSYGVRLKTLRAIYMDLGVELGEQGFKWIFVLQNHGSPMHNLSLDQAGDFFHDTYGGHMINLFGLEPPEFANLHQVPESMMKENGIDIHSGASETSRLLFIKPDLIDPGYRNAKPFPVFAPQDFSVMAAKDDWLGYFGSPRLATSSMGEKKMKNSLSMAKTIVERVLAGADPKKIPRFADQAMRDEAVIADRAIAYDAKIEKMQQDWIKKKGLSW